MWDDSESDDCVYPAQFVVADRCRACCFPFAEGDMIVADLDSRRSETMMYRDRENSEDDIMGAQITFCRDGDQPPCGARGALGYHEECLALWGSSLPPPVLGAATRFSFPVAASADRRRQTRIQALLCQKLRDNTLLAGTSSGLPAETSRTIARLLTRACAASTIQELWAARDSRGTVVDCRGGGTKDVWAQYVHIEGVRYVSRLTSARKPGSIRLFKAKAAAGQAAEKTGDVVVYAQEDFRGVRQLVWADADRDVSTLPGLAGRGPDDAATSHGRQTTWWRTLELGPSRKLHVVSDGLKIRSVDIRAPPPPKKKRKTSGCWKERGKVWPVPMPPARLAQLSVCRTFDLEEVMFDEDLEGYDYRMASFVCNGPDVTGYSVFWSQGRPLTIHAHRPGEDVSFYQDFEDHDPVMGLWTYAALGTDERIATIYVRRASYDDDMGLLFHTSRGRALVFGPHKVHGRPRGDDDGQETKEQPPYQHRLHLPADKPAQVYFSVSPNGIHQLACGEASFENTTQRAKAASHQGSDPQLLRAPVVVPAAIVQHPSFSDYSSYFCSRAVELQDVVSITPSYCLPRPDLIRPTVVCGVLLHYGDGRPPSSFGQFRFDHVGAPVHVAGAEALHFGFRPDVRLPHPHLVAVSVTPTTAESELTWVSVPLRGQAEMWFDAFRFMMC